MYDFDGQIDPDPNDKPQSESYWPATWVVIGFMAFFIVGRYLAHYFQ